jgi:ABC-2 type transport system permease protein
MIRTRVGKYRAFFRVARKHAWEARAELYGRIAFFAVILGVFSSLWRAIADAGMPLAADPRTLVWYVAATEWILLSAPPLHLDVQDAVRRGDVAYQLARPVSYTGAVFAEGLGLLAARAALLGVTAMICAFAFTGMVPPIGTIVWLVPLGMAGAALITAMSLAVGLLAFWLEDITPLYWVWQKLLFIFGGLMLPLELYPSVIRRIAAFTPFPAVLGGPASLLLAQGHVAVAALVWQLAMWSAVIAGATWLLFRRAAAAMAFNGG